MNFLDIDGTEKDSFSIGTGENKCDITVKNGKMYVRNFNSDLFQLSNQNLPTPSHAVEWSSDTDIIAGQIVKYSGRLFLSKTDHTTGITFDSDLYFFLLNYDSLTKINAANGITVYLNEYSSDILLTGSLTGTVVLILPNSLGMSLGKKINIINFSLCETEIYLFNETTLVSRVNVNQAKTLMRSDTATSDGQWLETDYWQLEEKEVNEFRVIEANSFQKGDIIAHNGTSFIKASLNSIYSPIGIVRDSDLSSFRAVAYGYIDLSSYSGLSVFPLVKGKQYYLSETAGQWDASYSRISQPAFIAFSDTEVIVNFKSRQTLISESFVINSSATKIFTVSDGIYLLRNESDPEKRCEIIFRQGNYITVKESFEGQGFFSDVQGNLGTMNIYESTTLNIENLTGSSKNMILTTVKGEWL